ncbi:hypothetical protein [Mesomycoplasma hyorhinis]|uniref:hypothetical protein n=1 Tax=Mesomycoplasma hyorhinis TaxID=2100 RepID=UPI001C04E683|nr:hypothetical protein [Mesomycoplasma hyorhinis]
MRWSSLSESEQKIQDANILKFENFFKHNRQSHFILENKKEFDNLNSDILKPIFQDYLNDFFLNTNFDQVLKEYNLYYFVGEKLIYEYHVSKEDLGWWWFGLLPSKKLFFVNPQLPEMMNMRLPFTGVQISIVAFKKSEKINFF